MNEDDGLRACDHRWDKWRTVVPSFDFAGRFVGASIAELHADEAVAPGWTRRCGLCGTLQTAYEDVAVLRAKAAAADRVRELADTYAFLGATLHDVPRAETWAAAATEIRAALDGADRTDRGRC